MRMPSVPKFKGKFKGEIVKEAFERLGPNATQKQVDKYFTREYGVPGGCDRSMFYTARATAKRAAKHSSNGVTFTSVVPPTSDTLSVIKALKNLANEVGGYDKLVELVNVLK